MYTGFNYEIARNRQADLTRRARSAHHYADLRRDGPRFSLGKTLHALASKVPHAAKAPAQRRVLRAAH